MPSHAELRLSGAFPIGMIHLAKGPRNDPRRSLPLPPRSRGGHRLALRPDGARVSYLGCREMDHRNPRRDHQIPRLTATAIVDEKIPRADEEPTLSPGELATKEHLYSHLASMWTVFLSRKHNTTPAVNGAALTSPSQAWSSHYSFHKAPTTPSGSTVRRPGRPSPHDIASVSFAYCTLHTLGEIPFRSIMGYVPLVIEIMPSYTL